MEVYNADIVAYHNLVNRVIEEQIFSQSSNTQKYKIADKARVKTFLSAMRFQMDVAKGVGNEYDLPKTDPRPYQLSDNPVIKLVRNDMVNHIVNLLVLCRDEMIASPSASDSSGMQDDDYARGQANVQRIENFLKSVVDVVSPLPFLESVPREPIQGKGRGDI